jgi:2-polyprenyl-6-methoxyphenol hydroxylase-like FAD-dependent oxidoreductase
VTPFRGIGANTALRDAQLLARNLIAAHRGEHDLLDAIADYERQPSDYGFAAVRNAMRSGKLLVSDSRFGRVMFKTVLRFCSAVPPLSARSSATSGDK